MERDVNNLMQSALELDRRIAEQLLNQYPSIKVIAGDLLEKKHVVGIRILTGAEPREFTCYYDGFYAQEYKEGLQGDIKVELMPNFSCKPIIEMTENSLSTMLDDEQAFLEQPFVTLQKYLPEIALKFKA
ncbi:MAG: hypothetical protein FH756_05700 [Firmicutes bacterium]|nr:hypothetical protein [Bacillota bacterium]